MVLPPLTYIKKKMFGESDEVSISELKMKFGGMGIGGKNWFKVCKGMQDEDMIDIKIKRGIIKKRGD